MRVQKELKEESKFEKPMEIPEIIHQSSNSEFMNGDVKININ